MMPAKQQQRYHRHQRHMVVSNRHPNSILMPKCHHGVIHLLLLGTIVFLSCSKNQQSPGWTVVHASVLPPSSAAEETKLQQEQQEEQQQAATKSSSFSFSFRHKTVIIPHDDKKHRGGEDAAASTGQLLVVADGVGGWANRGVNPGLYSRLLTQTIVELFQNSNDEDNETKKKDGNNDSSKYFLIDLVHTANHRAADQHLGSATCTVVQLTAPNTLQTLNIGDSGYSIHRRSKKKKGSDNNDDGDSVLSSSSLSSSSSLEVVFASTPGQKGFNFPYQIGGQYGDAVQDVAVLNEHSLQPGDVLVVYSDGVSDNLHPHEYHDCIDKYSIVTNSNDVNDDNDDETELELASYSLVADCIARQAYVLGKDKTFDSPFAQGARQVGKRYLGGKHDDITVTVAQVVVVPQGGVKRPTSSTGPSSAPTTTSTTSAANSNEEDEDPHYSESIFVYTGPVPSKDELPSLEHVLASKQGAAAAATGTGGGSTRDEL